jgi:hypothetical protein
VRAKSKIPLILVAVLLCVTLAAAKTCRSCGTENRDDATFCKSCGTRLPEQEPRHVPVTPRVRAEVSVSAGVVGVTSEPSGAAVYIDGTARGQTPLDVTGLSAGRHDITVSRSGYRDYNSTFTVSGQTGTIVVTTDPAGAEVWVDGELRGNTTATGLAVPRLALGTHRIAARMAGYQEAAREVDLNSVGPIAVSLRLGQGRGFLRIESEPTGATVTANSRRLGVTDGVFELTPNRYVLMLQRRGYQDWVGYADIAAAETARVSERLERLAARRLPLLIAGGVGLAAGGFGALRGEQEYASYRAAGNAADAEKYRRSTQSWDVFRNVALAAGAVCCGLYLTVRW